MAEGVTWLDRSFIEVAVVDVKTFREGVLYLKEGETSDVETVGII